MLRGETVPRTYANPSRYFKRYQDDSCNPTSYGNRQMVNKPFPYADLFNSDKPFGNVETAAIGYLF